MFSYNSKEKLSILVSTLCSGSSRKAVDIVNYFGDYDNLVSTINVCKQYIVDLYDLATYNTIVKSIKNDILDDVIAQLINKSITCVCYGQKNYPTILSEISDPPVTLYCKGDISLLNTDCFSVVGTRKVNTYGRRVTTNFVTVLAHYFTVVSGLAIGVDTLAHRATLSESGKTIAVLGGGLDNIYPSCNTELATNIIASGGLLISEYPPNVEPKQYTFPRRNRIVAGLSKGLLVCQAPPKSGTLSTINFALECGRDVFVVPGEIYDYGYMGSNDIIKSMQGAMITSPLDITKYYRLDSAVATQHSLPLCLTPQEQQIYDLLKRDKTHYNDIVEHCKILPQQANILLANMQIKGLIDRLASNIYCIIGGN